MVTVTVRSFFHGSGYGSAEPKILSSVVHYAHEKMIANGYDETDLEQAPSDKWVYDW